MCKVVIWEKGVLLSQCFMFTNVHNVLLLNLLLESHHFAQMQPNPCQEVEIEIVNGFQNTQSCKELSNLETPKYSEGVWMFGGLDKTESQGDIPGT